jgi:predicted DNA-binding transcriptional regulator YafY
MRASRLLNIQMLLESRGRMSAPELARALEVSVRTLYRDIDELSAAGVPVYAERGRDGGFQLLPGWKTSLTGFTPAEAEAVFLGGLGGPAAELGLHETMRSAQLKLLSSLPAGWRGSAQRIASRLHLDAVDWYREAEPSPHLARVAAAVWEERPLVLHYDSWRRSARHEVHPLGLVLKAGMWYLVAAREGQVRTFRVSSIASVEPLPGRLKRPRGFDLPAYWRQSVARFERELYAGRAEVAATARGLAHLRQLGAVVAHALREVQVPKGAARITVHIPVEAAPQAAAQLLRLAPEVEVLGPPPLLQAVLQRLEDSARTYGRTLAAGSGTLSTASSAAAPAAPGRTSRRRSPTR